MVLSYSLFWYIFNISLLKKNKSFIHAGIYSNSSDEATIITGTGGCGKTSTLFKLLEDNKSKYISEDFGIIECLDDNDNNGGGFKLNFTGEKTIKQDSFKPIIWHNEIDYELATQNFRYIERYRDVEFNRIWNRQLNNPTGNLKNRRKLFTEKVGVSALRFDEASLIS